MKENVVIEAQNLWKRYIVSYKKEFLLRQAISRIFNPHRLVKEIAALRDINLEIKRKETVGIIGRNASGKTTLLRVLCGITYPNQGVVRTRGRITPLLELGAGFHPELTGRENIYLNGSIIGLSKKQIGREIGSIINFADIGDFIDAPMRVYSSGMYLRLGCAIAVHAGSDAMLIDETLTVGDMEFEEKCRRRLLELRESGATIVFASHNLNLVQEMCDRAILLDRGMICKMGSPQDVVKLYMEMKNAVSESIGSHPLL